MKAKFFLPMALLSFGLMTEAQTKRTFVHPGGLHTETDFQRMREHKNEAPWAQSWQEILRDGYAQSTRGNEANYDNIGGGGNRQAAARDAYAAYLNTLRWRIEGTTANADCAVRIMNAWAARCTQASGELFQLPIFAFVQAAEMLRDYPGWKAADHEKFKTLVRTVFLPACLDFWTNCTHESWAGPAAAANMMMGVYLDDEDWKAIGKPGHGHNIGSVMNVVYDSKTGQIGEMGRDLPHAAIGPAFLAMMCQIAWNQGDDLYGFDNNRLLRGFEYYCKSNLNNPVPWVTYQWCASGDYQWFHISPSDGLRTNSSPVYEMVYNHYVVRQGLQAPYVTKMANLSRPEDSHAYLFTKVKGDAAITAHLNGANWGNTGSFRRIGLVVRETLKPNSRRLCMSVGDDWNRHSRFGYRTDVGGPTSHINGNDFTSSNVWFRIVRHGNTFTAYQAADTLNWAEVGSVTVPMGEDYYVGLASCANNTNGDQLAGTFDHVSVDGPYIKNRKKYVNF